MEKKKNAGVYQLKNGNWGFRYGLVVNGKTVWKKQSKDDLGNPYKTKNQAIKARQADIQKNRTQVATKRIITNKIVNEIYQEYCKLGRAGKAYATIKKQDSLWNNHISIKFGHRLINDISAAEINDYLTELYYTECRAYKYVESFLKMFYLIFGQAYSRDYLDTDVYNKLCKNKDTKIHMPKMKIDEENDIVVFSEEQLKILNDYFIGTNAETAYMLGRYCGLRINECYGLKWDHVDIDNSTIMIDRQMQYQDGIIKLVSLKTKNAKRVIYINERLKNYIKNLYQFQTNYTKSQFIQREQNQTMIFDINGEKISSLELVNSLPNGKIQTINSMKYHSNKIKDLYNINFKYHYLRHTYGTNLANLNLP